MKKCNRELWACALWVEKTKGASGPSFISERLGRLALQGDADGVAAWRGIAERYDALYHGLGAARQ
jgi:hypothetical protein